MMVVPEHGEMSGDAGCILVADPHRRLVWTNSLGPEFVPNIIGTGPHEFGFSVDIQLSEKDGGCLYKVVVSHGNTEDAKKHAEMRFEQGWGAATTQLEALAATL